MEEQPYFILESIQVPEFLSSKSSKKFRGSLVDEVETPKVESKKEQCDRNVGCLCVVWVCLSVLIL